MKRFLCVALCAALCLSLVACGGTGSNGNSKHDRLLQMLEEGNYTGAVDYINQLAREEAEQNKPDPGSHPLLSKLTGTWEEYSIPNDEQPDAPFVFHEDGTCTVGSDSYLWQVDTDYFASENELRVQVLDGASKVYNFDITKRKDTGLIISSAYHYSNDNYATGIGNFFNEAHYEKIDLSAENLEAYFEYVDYVTYNTNEFDEITSITLGNRLALKKEYHARLFSGVSNVAVEFSYLSGTQYGSFDLETKTYSLNGEFDVHNKGDRYNRTCSFGNYAPSNDDPYYGVNLFSSQGYTGTSGSQAGKQYFSGYHKDYRVERIQGAIYLLKTEK